MSALKTSASDPDDALERPGTGRCDPQAFLPAGWQISTNLYIPEQNIRRSVPASSEAQTASPYGPRRIAGGASFGSGMIDAKAALSLDEGDHMPMLEKMVSHKRSGPREGSSVYEVRIKNEAKPRNGAQPRRCFFRTANVHMFGVRPRSDLHDGQHFTINVRQSIEDRRAISGFAHALANGHPASDCAGLPAQARIGWRFVRWKL